ncbi:nucleotide kinase [Candidatus Caldarchaeum subterraneum]|uniref:Nucleoside-triphosphatase CSUB_C0283 n=1 Tax=Caldiarchaeum subterraneum TaxID=311458 RepID=E6N4Q5_CALS0|nr:nucleotide kinase [Candidatus Caldarchaeum subterraneum]BAJ50144.1 nucleotide kinase [Candidatus Caldarchaeum subterraneum]
MTGRPGVGKTTALMSVVELLRKDGVRVGGFYTRELRETGVRKGFEVVDIISGETALLASVSTTPGPRIGRYVVMLDNLERLGVGSLEKGLETCDVLAVDEVGPMELLSNKFVETVEKILRSGKPSIFTVHVSATHPVAKSVRKLAGENLYLLDTVNRDRVPQVVYEVVKKWLRS